MKIPKKQREIIRQFPLACIYLFSEMTSFVGTQMKLEIIMLSELSDSEGEMLYRTCKDSASV